MSIKAQTKNKSSKIFLEIERAKGFAILLVVYGHLMQARFSQDHDWYLYTKKIVYSFHMPMFMFLSGFVFWVVGYQNRYGTKFIDFLGVRANRILVPFLGFAVAVVFGKYLFVQFFSLSVYDASNDIGTAFYSVISNSKENPVLSVWYLLVLFIYTVSTPILTRGKNNALYLLMAVSFAVQFIDVTDRFYINRTLHYYFFFGLGCVFSIHRDFIYKYRASLIWTSGILTTFLYINIDSNNYKLVTSGLVSTVFFFLVIGTPIFSRDKILLFLGSHTMAIYLLNTIVIGTIAAVGFAFIPEDSFRFEIILTLGAIAGTMLPIAFKMLLEKMPALGFIAKYFQ